MTSDSHICSIIFIIDVNQLPIYLPIVSQILNKAGVYTEELRERKEYLTAGQKQIRLALTEEYAFRNQRCWNSVIFSDEKTFG
jgi:hypothetical protein